MYTGMHMFAKTRKRQLVDMLHENGLSISYTRVLEISSQIGEAVVAQYVEDGVVCPLVLRKKFTTRPVARLFCGGGQIGQILGPFMITGGLSCDRVEFGHFGGGVR